MRIVQAWKKLIDPFELFKSRPPKQLVMFATKLLCAIPLFSMSELSGRFQYQPLPAWNMKIF